MKNIILSVVVTLLVVAAAFFAWQYFSRQTYQPAAGAPQPEQAAPNSSNQNTVSLSEQPNQAKYDEYLSGIYLGKMPIGKRIGTDGFPTQTNVFASGADQFCTTMVLKKTITSGSLAVAVYNTASKIYEQPKTVFPMKLKAGGNSGCSDLTEPVGKYEYKLYIDGLLASVLPFEVK